MSKLHRVIIIDANAETVTEKSIELDLKALQDIVGGYIEAVPDSMTTGPMSNADTLYVNEEGLLLQKKKGFFIDAYSFAGNGVIVGYDVAKDKHIDAKTDLDKLTKDIKFIEINYKGENR